ncbi:hypothetical protein [Candidatus Uabimicrobium sp. HlEnr_7]|uniref:hypothetical protein n=1 Tax=Candidatus Uabimicrobium helgolandensis TaxID=3095367 RepID=UPI003557C84F
MNEKQIKEVDNKLVGPRLLCEIRGKKKANSPCNFCQCWQGMKKIYCRGCGSDDY